MQDDLATTAGLDDEMDWLQKLFHLSSDPVYENRAHQAPKCFVCRNLADAIVFLAVGNEQCKREPGARKVEMQAVVRRYTKFERAP